MHYISCLVLEAYYRAEDWWDTLGEGTRNALSMGALIAVIVFGSMVQATDPSAMYY